VCTIDSVSGGDWDTECLAAVRLLLLSADAAAPATANVLATGAAATTIGASALTCGVLPRCLLPVADILQSAGTHVYLSTVKLHRAMMMMVILTAELGTAEGQISAIFLLYFVVLFSEYTSDNDSKPITKMSVPHRKSGLLNPRAVSEF